MTLTEFNKLSEDEALNELSNCCGSQKWSMALLQGRPYTDEEHLINASEKIYYEHCNEADWKEAFTAHPKIGEEAAAKNNSIASLKHAKNEQAKVKTASDEVLFELKERNKQYLDKYGFIFIVSAAGRSAEEILRLLNDRLKNNLEEELQIAMGEQYKITVKRMADLFSNSNVASKSGQITTHILDTSSGRPAGAVTVKLQSCITSEWRTFTQGVTNSDGRIADLLPPGKKLKPGIYKLVFETAGYFKLHDTESFYPRVEIQFNVFDDKHYHVPLLLNPFGYSTYRGS